MKSIGSFRAWPVWLGGCVLSACGVWYALRTAEAQTAPAINVRLAPGGEYVLAYGAMHDKDVCETIVYHTGSGQSWIRSGTAWNKIEESAPAAAGKYQVTIVPSTQGGYWSFRLDQATGKTWYIKEQKWVAYDPLAQ